MPSNTQAKARFLTGFAKLIANGTIQFRLINYPSRIAKRDVKGFEVALQSLGFLASIMAFDLLGGCLATQS